MAATLGGTRRGDYAALTDVELLTELHNQNKNLETHLARSQQSENVGPAGTTPVTTASYLHLADTASLNIRSIQQVIDRRHTKTSTTLETIAMLRNGEWLSEFLGHNVFKVHAINPPRVNDHDALLAAATKAVDWLHAAVCAEFCRIGPANFPFDQPMEATVVRDGQLVVHDKHMFAQNILKDAVHNGPIANAVSWLIFPLESLTPADKLLPSKQMSPDGVCSTAYYAALLNIEQAPVNIRTRVKRVPPTVEEATSNNSGDDQLHPSLEQLFAMCAYGALYHSDDRLGDVSVTNEYPIEDFVTAFGEGKLAKYGGDDTSQPFFSSPYDVALCAYIRTQKLNAGHVYSQLAKDEDVPPSLTQVINFFELYASMMTATDVAFNSAMLHFSLAVEPVILVSGKPHTVVLRRAHTMVALGLISKAHDPVALAINVGRAFNDAFEHARGTNLAPNFIHPLFDTTLWGVKALKSLVSALETDDEIRNGHFEHTTDIRTSRAKVVADIVGAWFTPPQGTEKRSAHTGLFRKRASIFAMGGGNFLNRIGEVRDMVAHEPNNWVVANRIDLADHVKEFIVDVRRLQVHSTPPIEFHIRRIKLPRPPPEKKEPCTVSGLKVFDVFTRQYSVRDGGTVTEPFNFNNDDHAAFDQFTALANKKLPYDDKNGWDNFDDDGKNMTKKDSLASAGKVWYVARGLDKMPRAKGRRQQAGQAGLFYDNYSVSNDIININPQGKNSVVIYREIESPGHTGKTSAADGKVHVETCAEIIGIIAEDDQRPFLDVMMHALSVHYTCTDCPQPCLVAISPDLVFDGFDGLTRDTSSHGEDNFIDPLDSADKAAEPRVAERLEARTIIERSREAINRRTQLTQPIPTRD